MQNQETSPKIDRAVQRRFESAIHTLQQNEGVNLTEKIQTEIASDLVYDRARSAQTMREINNSDWKDQAKFHLKTAVATVVVGVGAAFVAGAIAGRIAKRSSVKASDENAAAGTDENPFADAGVSASDRPSTLRRAASH